MRKIVAEKREKLKTLFLREFTYLPSYLFLKLVREKEIKINGKPAEEGSEVVSGDEVVLYFRAEKYPLCEEVYRSAEMLVVNKKRGVSFENLCSVLQEENPALRPVHRLDTNTAGLVVFALNQGAEAELLAAFREKRVEKRYLCRVYGVPNPKKAVLSDYLVKNAASGLVRVVSAPQKGALTIVTEYRLEKDLKDGTSVLSVTLHTGRTHQIRAHLAHIGHFVLGDGKYGRGEINRR